jgi:TolB-like protein/class 3 adenylate cyclase/tetratricopeptide (TPR) repeat protein
VTAARRLAAILAADVVGYSRLMGEDEAGTAKVVRERREAATPIMRSFGGRLVKTTGDGILLEFPSVIAAVECAILIQKMMAERNAALPEAKRVRYRMGVNLGDVLVEGDDILGDGVNIAARLEGICEPGGVCVSGAAYEHIYGRIGVEFVDLGAQTLKNIAKPMRAYALSTDVIAAAKAEVPAAVLASANTRSPLERNEPPRLSLVVLPFANIGGDPEQDYFVDGVTESLTTELSRIEGAFVISRSTAFTFKGKPFDVKTVGCELNVRYVLEGSVQRAGNRMRVNVQLIDAESGSHLSADQFDRPVADYFQMQDEIVGRLAGQLNATLILAEARKVGRSSNPDAFDFYLQGVAWLHKAPFSKGVEQARSFFARALAIEPDNVATLIGCAAADIFELIRFEAPERSKVLATAEASLSRALSLAPDSAGAHLFLSFVRSLSNRPEEGVFEAERALALDPNLPNALAAMGAAKLFAGFAEKAIECQLQAVRLSARDPNAHGWMCGIGAAKLHLGDYEAAANWLSQSVVVNPNFSMAHFFLAAALGQLGRIREARAEVQAGLVLNPTFTISSFRDGAESDNPIFLKQRDNIYEGLRKARLPEGAAKTY